VMKSGVMQELWHSAWCKHRLASGVRAGDCCTYGVWNVSGWLRHLLGLRNVGVWVLYLWGCELSETVITVLMECEMSVCECCTYGGVNMRACYWCIYGDMKYRLRTVEISRGVEGPDDAVGRASRKWWCGICSVPAVYCACFIVHFSSVLCLFLCFLSTKN
jgi:hypothetical protein